MKRRDGGFTLIELMVVIMIIAVLIAIAIPAFLGFRDAARARSVRADTPELVRSTLEYIYTNDLSDKTRSEGELQAVFSSEDLLVLHVTDGEILHIIEVNVPQSHLPNAFSLSTYLEPGVSVGFPVNSVLDADVCVGDNPKFCGILISQLEAPGLP